MRLKPMLRLGLRAPLVTRNKNSPPPPPFQNPGSAPDNLYDWNNPKATYFRTTDIFLAVVIVVVVVVVLASAANNHSQNILILASELPIRGGIY